MQSTEDTPRFNSPTPFFSTLTTQNSGLPPLEEFNLESLTSVSLTLEYPIIQTSSEHSVLVKMLASLKVDNLPNYKRSNIDLVCVLDRSGSMVGEKLDLVKNTFKYLLDFFDEGDRLGIVSFNHEASIVFPLEKMDSQNKQKIRACVNKIEPIGSTSIDGGLSLAMKILKERRFKNAVTSIFLLSDGIDNDGTNNILSRLEQGMKLQELTVNTFGFGNDHDSKLMSSIADVGDGTFYYIENFGLIDECFIDCFGQLVCATAKKVEIRINVTDEAAAFGIKIVNAFGGDALWQIENETYITRIASLLLGKSRNYMLEIEFPCSLKTAKENFPIAKIEASFMDFQEQISKKSFIVFSNIAEESEEFKNQRPDPEVLKHYYRTKAASIIEHAYRLGLQGNFDAATQALKGIKAELEGSEVRELDFIKNLAKDITRAEEDIAPNNFKQRGGHNLLGNARAQMKESTYSYTANYYGTATQMAMQHTLTIMKNTKKKDQDQKEECESPEKILSPDKSKSSPTFKKTSYNCLVLFDKGLNFARGFIEEKMKEMEIAVTFLSFEEFKDTEKSYSYYVFLLNKVSSVSERSLEICQKLINLYKKRTSLFMLKHPYCVDRLLKIDKRETFSFQQFNYTFKDVIEGYSGEIFGVEDNFIVKESDTKMIEKILDQMVYGFI